MLPTAFRATDVYIPVDLCGANNGRLYIETNGKVTVQAEGGTFSNVQCFRPTWSHEERAFGSPSRQATLQLRCVTAPGRNPSGAGR